MTTLDKLMALADGYKRGSVRFDYLRAALIDALDQGEPVSALMRVRYLMTPARIAHDRKDHFSEWGAWAPTTYKHAKAVTDPARNTDPLLYEMLPLYAAKEPKP